jgi:hypothetical protein
MGELNMSVPSVRRAIKTSFGANVSAFVDIEIDLLNIAWSRSRAARAWPPLMPVVDALVRDPPIELRAGTVGS